MLMRVILHQMSHKVSQGSRGDADDDILWSRADDVILWSRKLECQLTFFCT